jgi:hypothetical protein
MSYDPNKIFSGAYDYDYYSGYQCGLYIGDVYIDEIVRVGFNLSHEKVPIYSCCSKYWDTVAEGQVIVQGELAINYKEEAYLQIVLSQLGTIAENIKGNSSTGLQVLSGEGGDHTGSTRTNIELIMRDFSLIGSSQNTPSTEQRILEQLYGMLDLGKGSGDFEQIAEMMEDQIWKKELSGSGNFNSQLSTPTNHEFPFDIYIIYGDYSNNSANHTSKKISAVHLTGESQTITLDGQPIIETYPFIARGINLPT